MILVRAALAVLLAAAAAACVSPPPFAAREGDLIVRADDEPTAALALREVRKLRGQLQARIPDIDPRPVDVWLQHELSSTLFGRKKRENTKGFTIEPLFVDTVEIHLLADDWISPLPHELVHAWLGPSWKPLPGLLQEGLCDHMAEELGPFPGLRNLRVRNAARQSSIRVRYSWRGLKEDGSFTERDILFVQGTLEVADEPIPLDEALAQPLRGSWRSRSSAEIGHLYGLGYVVARWILERGGVDALHALCVRARESGLGLVPPDWIRAAAGIESEEAFEQRLAEELRAAVVREVRQGGDLGGWICTSRAQIGDPNANVDQFLELARPRLSIGDGPDVPLEEIEGLTQWMRNEWELMRPDGG